MKVNRVILCGILCSAMLGSALMAPAGAAGVVDGITTDTTCSVVRAVGKQYRFTVTPQQKGAKVSYTVGNGTVLRTFTAEKPTQNRNGTTTYHFGFQCLSAGKTGVYLHTEGKTIRLFPVQVTPDYQAIQKSVDNGHFPYRIVPAETARDFIGENNLSAKVDFTSTPTVTENKDGTVTVVFLKGKTSALKLVLYQPVKKGKGGIWAVRSWTDLATGTVHTVG